MPRTVGKLTQKQVVNAKPPEGRPVMLADGGNLYLQCTLGADGSVRRSWVFRYELDGCRHELGLGPLHSRSLREARDRARELRLQILDGIDPLDARRAAKREQLAQRAAQAKAATFEECAAMFLKVHSDKWRSDTHRAQWASSLKAYAFPVLGGLAVADIEVGHVQKALGLIWRRVPETARRTRGRIEMVLDYATAARLRHGDNPASWKVLKHLLGGKKQVEHLAALPFIELPTFYAELRKDESIPCQALRFAILTASRTGEVLGAEWSEIDLAAKMWIVPAARMKGGREHRVPLNNTAVAILKALPRRGPYVFSIGLHGERLADKALRRELSRLRPGVTTHGFRSSFRDWAAERTNYPNFVVEMALAHSIGGAVEKAYRRGDLLEKRRKLMEQWEQFLANPPVEKMGTNITPIHRKVSAEAS
jgi:integrase